MVQNNVTTFATERKMGEIDISDIQYFILNCDNLKFPIANCAEMINFFYEASTS